MNKICVIAIISLALFSGCIRNEKEEIPSSFKTDAFRIGDEITYEVGGNMVISGRETGYLIYYSYGEAIIKIKDKKIDDGFGNMVNTIEFHMELDEIPYNHTIEKREDLPVNVEKHIYRIYNGSKIGGIVKSITIHHAINREREIQINSFPLNDIIDFFLQKELMNGMNGSFYYNGMEFKWKATYDKNTTALRIEILTNVAANLSIWIKNGYSLPYQISFSSDDGTRYNKYTYVLKKFKRGNGKEFYIGDINYSSQRNIEFYEWKNFKAPFQGEESKFKMDIRAAMAQALAFGDLKKFLRMHEDAYMVYAEYWESKNEAGWLLHFANKQMREDYVLNISNSGRAPIPSTDLSPYLPYEEIPKDIDDISDELMSITDAEKIFAEMRDFYGENYTFKVSFVENYYPDSLFDIWEGNSKEKEISLAKVTPRGACLIAGFHGMVKEYSFGYRLTALSPPFIAFDGKINGENGMITYVYEEY